jgi:diaminopimelate epimerase
MLNTYRRPLADEYVNLLFRGENAFWRLKFSIMHGNGNVLAIVDEALSELGADELNGTFASKICQSFQALRVDGIAFLGTTGGKVRMTYFERDGTRSVMCGNALRCSARYAFEQGYLWAEDFVATDDGDKWVSVAPGKVQVTVGPARQFHRVDKDRYFIFSGLPHLVAFVDDLDGVDVRRDGAALRHDQALCARVGHPEGIHVDFVRQEPDGIRIRTYEVGVEDETLACGTGSAGSAFVASRALGLPLPMRVGTRGGDITVGESQHGLTISGTTEYLFSNIRAASLDGPAFAS